MRSPLFTCPLFKKDGRTWLHKTSARAKYGKENLIAGRFKKDSRIWLHKTTRKRKLFMARSDNSLMEIDCNIQALKEQLSNIYNPCTCAECQRQLKAKQISFVQGPAMGDGQLSTATINNFPGGKVFLPDKIIDIGRKESMSNREISPAINNGLMSPRARWKNILLNQLKNS